MSRAEKNSKVEAAIRGVRFNKKWIRVECPFCADEGHRDTKRSLGISVSTGYYSCFRCAAYGYLEEPPDPDAHHETTPEDEEEVKPMAPPEYFCAMGERTNWDSYSLEDARKYLLTRKVDRKLAKRMQIGACDEGYFAGRVVIPFLVGDEDTWIGYITRLWVKSPSPRAQGKAALKYLYPAGMPRGRFFWNHKALLVETDTPLYIVEGAFDAIPFWPDAVATLGKISDEQMEAMLIAKRPIVQIPDGDAWQEGWAITQRLRFEGKRAGYIKLPPRVDPDEVDEQELRADALKSLDDPL